MKNKGSFFLWNQRKTKRAGIMIYCLNITDTYRDTLKNFYNNYLSAVEKYGTSTLDENDRLSYKIFAWEMKMQLETLDLGTINPGDGSWLYIPFNQFWGLPITMGRLGQVAGFSHLKLKKIIMTGLAGHHYQISLQQENESLPKFRRFAWYGAMSEGWASVVQA